MRSIRARLLALAAVWIVVALLAAFLVIGGVLARFVTDRYDAELRAVSDALIAATEVEDDGKLDIEGAPADPRFQMPLSGWYWQVQAGSRVARKSPSLFDATLQPKRGGDGAGRGRGPRGEPLRLLAQTFTPPGGSQPLLLMVAAPAREIGESLAEVGRPLALSLAVLGLGLGVAVAVQVGSGLGSLRRVGDNLRLVRAGGAERLPRAGLAEIDPLVDEINAALDQNATLLARSRQHLGNLAHSLKTPLAALANELPPDDPGQALIARMDRLIGWHLRRARSAQPRVLGTRTAVLPVIEDILLVLRHPAEDKGIAIETACPPGLGFAGERQDLEEMIGNLAENAVKWGRARVRILGAGVAGGGVRISIEDDGPGLSGDEAQRAVIRGARLDETGPPGAGLGLSIVADLAALHGGELRLARSPLGGLAAELHLPG